MNHFKLVHRTTAPTRYTKIVFSPGKDTKFVKQYQETEYVSRYTKIAAVPASLTPPPPPEPLETVWGSMWVTKDPFYANTTAIAKTAVYTGGTEPVSYRYRVQKRVTGDTAISNGEWSYYDNGATEIPVLLPAPGYDVRFQSQAQDSIVSNTEFTGWKQVKPQPTIGTVTISPDNSAASVMSSQTFTAVVTGGDATDLTYKWTVRSGNAQLDTPDNQASVTYTFIRDGSTQIQCAVSSANSSNSPQSNIALVVVSA